MDPFNQSPVAPAPASPEAVPGIPNTASSTELSQEQMKTNLQDMMSKINEKYSQFKTQKFSSDNIIKKQKGEALRQLFDFFQSKGIDPNNPEDIKAYLDNIKEKRPELYAQIEQAIQTILGDEPEVAPSPAAEIPSTLDEANNMNINQNEAPQETV